MEIKQERAQHDFLYATTAFMHASRPSHMKSRYPTTRDGWTAQSMTSTPAISSHPEPGTTHMQQSVPVKLNNSTRMCKKTEKYELTAKIRVRLKHL
jgi:hypothetical protein